MANSNGISKFLPIGYIVLRSSLSPKEIEVRLSDSTMPGESSFSNQWSKPLKPYQGYVLDSSFRITPQVNYRNSFLPLLQGVVEADVNGARVSITLGLQPIVKLFMAFWCGLLGFMWLILMVSWGVSGNFIPEGFMPLVMLLFGYTLMMSAFNYSSNKAINELKVLLAAEDACVGAG